MNKKFNVFKKLFMLLLVVVLLITLLVPLLEDYKFGLDLKGGFEVLYDVETVNGDKLSEDMLTNTYKTLVKRIDVLGVAEPVITIEGDNIRVQLAGVTDEESARDMLSQTANLSFRDTNDNLLMTADVLKAGGARVSQDDMKLPAVSLSVNDKDKFFSITNELSKKEDNRIVIWLDYDASKDSFKTEEPNCGSLNDSKCLSVATVSQGFASDVIIQGSFENEEVEELVNLINSGSLPTKLTEISSKTVNASFGENALNSTFYAGLIGILLIMVFMTLIYKFAGFVSSIGILIYTFVTLFIFWLIGGVLTLPGIAAMVIGVGMAVDASVISFARIKEKLVAGNSLKQSCILGNKQSLKSIIDANVTTLIAAFILFLFGESSVKGFATMLIISTLVTMVIMLGLLRFLITMFVETDFFNEKLKLFIGVKDKHIVSSYNKNPKSLHPFSKIDFIKMRGKFYVLTSLLILVGVVSLMTQGLTLGVDFKGGTSISLASQEKINKSDIEKELKDLKYNIIDIEKIDNKNYEVKIEDVLTKEQINKTNKLFEEEYKIVTDIGVVSNIVKLELIKNAVLATIFALIGIILYIIARFKMSYAIAAVLAVMHDVFIIFAAFSLFNFEVSSIFIAALLSIIGYSINDTIVTFDKTRELLKDNKIKNKDELKDAVNDGLRITLTRSIITTITTIIPVVTLIMLGSHEIIYFNVALLIGLISGAYSSIFIATSIFYDIEKKSIGKKKKKKWYEDVSRVEEKTIEGINK